MTDPTPSQPPGTQKPLLHYRLTHEEWLEINRRLKPSEIKLLYYLRTLDPFGDRELELGVREIAQDLDCDPGTVSRALRRLAEAELIDLELIRVRVRLHSKVLSPDNNVVSTQQPRSPHNTDDRHTTPAIATQHPRSSHNNRDPEPSPDAASRTPQTIQTIQTDQSLSLRDATRTNSDPPKPERETIEADPDFRNWLAKKAAQFPQPPQLLEQWIDRQAKLESNQRDYLKSRSPQTKTNIPPRPPDRFQIESACISAHDSGDRGFILAKLTQLWRDGWHDLIEDLCQLYPTWGLMATNCGVVEVGEWLT